jgi:hypothetical protein
MGFGLLLSARAKASTHKHAPGLSSAIVFIALIGERRVSALFSKRLMDPWHGHRPA